MTLIPLFDENMTVCAYSLFTQKQNKFLNTRALGTGEMDGITQLEGLEIIDSMGLDTISSDKEVFIPINNISIFADIESQCVNHHGKVSFLIDNTIPPEDKYVNRILELKKAGFHLAIRKLEVKQFQEYAKILQYVDYMFLNHKRINMDSAKIFFAKMYPQIKLCAEDIDSQETYEELKSEGGYQFYEGEFYRTPITKGEHEVTPLKVNYIELLNMVNNQDFELTGAADIIGRDTALVIDLLKVVNKVARNSEIISIKYAAAMLGQKELKRWINTVVTKKMYSSKPNEITRLSLLRAKFAENLAPLFGLAMKKQELFLMGLFSVLDIIMEKSMEEALKVIQVSKDIENVLLNKGGVLAPVYEFMINYENANWQEVSRLMILENLPMDEVSTAYINSLEWYRDLFAE
jgi:EAL and modified HD-GYP domain-containing signal transduction protein